MDKPIIARREVTNHILHTFKLKADKRLGQNFLIDEEVVRRIVAAAELSEDDTVLEVGPGIGTLTQGLAQSGARVVASSWIKGCCRCWQKHWKATIMCV